MISLYLPEKNFFDEIVYLFLTIFKPVKFQVCLTIFKLYIYEQIFHLLTNVKIHYNLLCIVFVFHTS